LYELCNSIMEIVSDAGAFLAVALNEVDREWVIGKTLGYNIVSPEVLPYEIGNALIAMKRKGRLSDREILRAFNISQRAESTRQISSCRNTFCDKNRYTV